MLERRLIIRLLSYWEEKCNGRPILPEQEVDRDELQDVWDDCFLIRLSDTAGNQFRVIYHGTNLPPFWPDHAVLAPKVKAIVEKRIHLMEDAEITDASGTLLKYRQCLLPLGEGEQVTAILGGARFKKMEG